MRSDRGLPPRSLNAIGQAQTCFAAESRLLLQKRPWLQLLLRSLPLLVLHLGQEQQPLNAPNGHVALCERGDGHAEKFGHAELHNVEVG